MNSVKKQKDRTLKDELPRSVGAQHATGDEWRNNSRKTEGMEPKQKQQPIMDGAGDRSRFNAVRTILHRNLECQVHESRQIRSGQTRDGKSERRHFRNQQNKMDWSG